MERETSRGFMCQVQGAITNQQHTHVDLIVVPCAAMRGAESRRAGWNQREADARSRQRNAMALTGLPGKRCNFQTSQNRSSVHSSREGGERGAPEIL